MLTVLFFISVFSSLTWLVYIVLYIIGQLGGNDLSSLDATTLGVYAALTVLPVWIVWQVFGFVNQYFGTKTSNNRLEQLFNQMKKNQDYTDLVVRVMLDAEHEIKDGFVINKFDVFVADMNEILADVVQRCNAASSLQLEQLWSRIKNGERWTMAKTLVEASKSHSDFSSYLAEKAQKDSVFKGTLLEFCSRYQNLNALLEKHDRDRTFITIIETGVMGKVYSILAPVVDALDNVQSETSEVSREDAADYVVPAHILTMQEPKSELRPSFLSKINPFKKKRTPRMETREPELKGTDDDEFFAALQKSMTTPAQTHKEFKTQESLSSGFEQPEESRFEMNMPKFDMVEEVNTFTASGLSNYKDEDVEIQTEAENEEDELSLLKQGFEDEQNKDDDNFQIRSNVDVNEDKIDVFSEQPSIQTRPTKAENNENFAYPFGGWINEDNYKK